MHLFYIPECTIQNRNVHISVLNGAFWDMEQVHTRICEIDLIRRQWSKLLSQASLHWIIESKGTFSNMTFDWMAAMLPANQMPCKNMKVSDHMIQTKTFRKANS